MVEVYLGGWWRWALVGPDGVAPSWMVGVSASVSLPLHRKVQKVSSGTGSPGWSRKKGRKTVVVWWWWLYSAVTDVKSDIRDINFPSVMLLQERCYLCALKPSPSGESEDETSSVGLKELIDTLSSCCYRPKRDAAGTFVFAVDHCFSIRGHGTIMTGTVISGSVAVNDVRLHLVVI